MSVTTADILTTWRRTSPIAVVFFAGRFLRRLGTDGLPALLPLFAWVAAADGTQKSVIIGVLLVIAALCAVWAVLSYLRFTFRIEADQVVVRQGVLHREQTSADFDRIQNVSVKEPFYMRPFGLAVVSIDTAGSAGKEMMLGGVDRDLALALRRVVLSEATVGSNSGDDAGQEAAGPSCEEGTVLLERDSRDVALFGLTANFMLWFAVAMGLFFSANELWEPWVDSVIDSFGIDSLSALMTAVGPLLFSILLVAAIAGLLLLLPLFSVMGAFLRHYGFRLVVDGETYRRFGGLLSRHDESLKQHKIQAVVWKQNAIARLLQRTNIHLRVASAGTGAEDSVQLGGAQRLRFMVPSLRDDERDALTTEFLPGCAERAPAFSAIDVRRFTLKFVLLGWVPISSATVLGPSLAFGAGFALVLLPLVALGTLISLQLARRQGYAIDGQYGFIRSGFLGSEVTVFPLFKVQRVDLRQTPGQRRAGRAHLIVHLASHSLTVPYVEIADAERFRDLAVYHAETDLRPWY